VLPRIERGPVRYEAYARAPAARRNDATLLDMRLGCDGYTPYFLPVRAFDFSGHDAKYISAAARRLANDAEMPNSDAQSCSLPDLCA